MTPQEQFYLRYEEPMRGCILALRTIILSYDERISETWKYGMPFFEFNGKWLCYLWTHKKSTQPYIGFVDGHRIEHATLIAEKRSRIKIMLFDPLTDLPLETIHELLDLAIALKK